MRRMDHSAADVERRADDRVGAEPLQPEHRADDVDDRVEGADFVEMHLLDRHLVNRRLGVRQPLEQRLRAVASGFGECGSDRSARRSPADFGAGACDGDGGDAVTR